MKLDLRDIPFYYINLDDAVERKEKTESQLKELGIKHVTRVPAIRHTYGAAGTPRSMLAALKLARSIPYGKPFVLLEDDVSVKRWDPIIDIPEDTDAFYLGISGWGRMNSHSGPFVQWERVPGSDTTLRVYNMLSGHAIMYWSDRYIDLAMRICYHAGYNIEDHVDIGFAEVQRWHNVYAFDDPYFYQTSSGGNQTVTYSPLSEQQSVECITYMKPYYLPQRVI
tara:strand:+ start:1064 stop:1735 length:672 start_codon:yes stop_codon:yes gene_type:complete